MTFKGKDKESLSFVLDWLNDFYWDCLEDSPSKVDIAWKYKGIKMSDAIRSGYDSVERLVSNDPKFDYLSSFGMTLTFRQPVLSIPCIGFVSKPICKE